MIGLYTNSSKKKRTNVGALQLQFSGTNFDRFSSENQHNCKNHTIVSSTFSAPEFLQALSAFKQQQRRWRSLWRYVVQWKSSALNEQQQQNQKRPRTWPVASTCDKCQTPSKRRTNGRTNWQRHTRAPTTSTTIAAVTPCRRRCDSSTRCKRHVSVRLSVSYMESDTTVYRQRLTAVMSLNNNEGPWHCWPTEKVRCVQKRQRTSFGIYV